MAGIAQMSQSNVYVLKAAVLDSCNSNQCKKHWSQRSHVDLSITINQWHAQYNTGNFSRYYFEPSKLKKNFDTPPL
jgi:hypothetical protein